MRENLAYRPTTGLGCFRGPAQPNLRRQEVGARAAQGGSNDNATVFASWPQLVDGALRIDPQLPWIRLQEACQRVRVVRILNASSGDAIWMGCSSVSSRVSEKKRSRAAVIPPAVGSRAVRLQFSRAALG